MREREIAFNHFSVFGEDCLQSWIKAMMFCLGGFAKTITKQVVCCNLAPKFPPNKLIWPANSWPCGAHLVPFLLPS